MGKKSLRRDGLVFSTGPTPVEENQNEESVPGGKAEAVLRIERKGRGGKTVTIVELRGSAIDDAKFLGKKLKSACGTGGTTKDEIIEIQGEFRDKIRPILEKEGILVKG